MRKMISVLLAGVLAVNLGACLRQRQRHLKKQNLVDPAVNHGSGKWWKAYFTYSRRVGQVTKPFLNEAAGSIHEGPSDSYG